MLKNFVLKTSKTCHCILRQRQFSNTSAIFTNIRHAESPTSAAYTLEQAHIDEAIKIAPILASYNQQLWQRAHATFVNHGLETINFLRIVTGNPVILQRTPERIIDTLEIWRSCQFGEKLLFLLLTKYPELLDVTDARRLLERIAYLRSRVTTNKNVWKILMNSPDLLEQTEQNIEQKFKYLNDVMRIEVPEIVKSLALTQTLPEIRCRHVFLTRLGQFTPRSLKAEPHERSKNHRLYQITDTSEKTFATKICHVTLDEYLAFKELYARELARKNKTKDDDNEDFSDNDEI